MNLTRPGDLKKLLEAHGLQLTRRFGQHFLIDRNLLLKVVETAEVGAGDAILEIGPGAGTLTVELAQRAEKVVAVELDSGVLRVLEQTLTPYNNVTVIPADALKLDLAATLSECWGEGVRGKVVANIPYNITSPLLIKFLEAGALFSTITLMVQKEVADRLRARPDTNDYGSLTVFVQYHAEVRVAGLVPRSAFFPPPRVDSAIVQLTPRSQPPVDTPDDAAFFAVSRAAFGQRRKTLLNALSNAGLSCPSQGEQPITKEQVVQALTAAGIEPQRRGETLSLEELAAVARALFGSSTH